MSEEPIALEARGADGAKRFSPSAARNREAIAGVLSDVLPVGAHVLEIASGTGEHAVRMVQARPDLTWQTSDPDADSRASQDAWARDGGGRLLASLDLDVTALDWWAGLSGFDALFCANMIHIAPWAATEGLASGAGQILTSGGRVALYGPFLWGEATAPSNLDFDRSLKARNPAWGVRKAEDVKAIFALAGLALERTVAMPANNHMLLFRRR